MTHNEYLEKLLIDLGNTPDEVAQALTKARMRGPRNKCQYCPIAKYIRAHAWGRGVSVGGRYALVEPFVANHIPVPEAVRSFIVQFDRYSYPKLEARE